MKQQKYFEENSTYDKKIETYKDTLRASIYKELCLKADDFSRQSNVTPYGKRVSIIPQNYSIAGYEPVNPIHKTNNNFKAVTFKKENEIVVCFVGTDFKSPKDELTNTYMAFGGIPNQFEDAEKYLGKTKKDYPDCKIVLANHSEGAAEGLYARGLNKDIEVFNYNGYGAKKFFKGKDGEINVENILNYRTPKDVVSNNFTTSQIGDIQIIPAVSKNTKFTPDFIYQHRLENMDFNTTLIDMEYELKQNPNFESKCKDKGIDKLRQASHEIQFLLPEVEDRYASIEPKTNNDFILSNEFDLDNLVFPNKAYGLLSSGEYKHLEPLLDILYDKGNILDDYQINTLLGSGNLVEVDSYTRDDGTHVKAYVRSAPKIH